MHHEWKKYFKQALKDYCKNTSMHGYKYLVEADRPIIEKFFWALILITNILMTSYVFKLMMNDYGKQLTITTLDSTKYPVTKVPFPAISICSVNRISRKAVLKKSQEIFVKINVSEDEIFYLMRGLGKLYDFELENMEELRKLQNIVDQYTTGLNNFDVIMDLVYDLSPPCEETMVKCFWLGVERKCSDIFFTRRTMDGYCCTFNYVKTWRGFNFSSKKKSMLVLNQPMQNMKEYYFEGAGVDMGLTVIIYSDPEDYYYPLTSTEGFSIKVFNSFEYPDISSGALIETYVPLKHETYMQIKPSTVMAKGILKMVPVHERGCVFKSEGKTVLDNTFYSFSDCLSECKLKSILAICECIPFFLPVLQSYAFSKQICSISDIACLNKHKEKWMSIYPVIKIEELETDRENSIHCPQCIPSCSFTTYNIDTSSAYLVDVKNKKGLNLSLHSVVHIYSDTEDTLLYKSDVSYYWFDIISNFGGTCSLFLGFSLISIVEFMYFISVKYLRLLKKNKL